MRKKILKNPTDIWDEEKQELIRNWEIWIIFKMDSINNFKAQIKWYYFDYDKIKRIGSCTVRGTTLEKAIIKLEYNLNNYFTEPQH